MIDNEQSLLSIEQDLLEELEESAGKIPQLSKIQDRSSGYVIKNNQITELSIFNSNITEV